MKKFLLSLILASTVTPVLADPIKPDEYKTPHSLGCMLVQDCVDDVEKIHGVSDLTERLGSDYSQYQEEIDGIIIELDKMGVEVFLSSDHYFLRGTSGVYYTVGNKFFLNESYSYNPDQLIKTLRHEAWHAAQDAMAGTIDNNFIAIIRNQEDVPKEFVLLAEIAYPPNAQPWEAEAKWAGDTPGMTLEVLKIINDTNGRPWETIEPTPLTREYLVNEGYVR
tara:strand:- start:1417 stop:2082 length:666 start_codon:yes stop_codon:yes gene_type:complete